MEVFQSVINSCMGAMAGFCIWNIIHSDGGAVSFVCAGVFVAALLTSKRV